MTRRVLRAFCLKTNDQIAMANDQAFGFGQWWLVIGYHDAVRNARNACAAIPLNVLPVKTYNKGGVRF